MIMSELDGQGTEEDPYKISNWYHLDAVREHLDSHFEVTSDLDEETEGYDDVVDGGFEPIGDGYNPFNGVLDGQRHEIKGLEVYKSEMDDIGIFRHVGREGEITDMDFTGVYVHGNENVGGVVGYNKGVLRRVYTSGEVVGSKNVGGLVGVNVGLKEQTDDADVSVELEEFQEELFFPMTNFVQWNVDDQIQEELTFAETKEVVSENSPLDEQMEFGTDRVEGMVDGPAESLSFPLAEKVVDEINAFSEDIIIEQEE